MARLKIAFFAVHLGEVLDKGFHHTNNVEKVVKEKFPEAKQVGSVGRDILQL